MDPFSIIVGCTSLLGAIANVSKHIGLFVSEVRSARKDMDAVNRELASLSLCLEALQVDCTSRRVEYPESMRTHLGQCLNNCDIITQQMKELLQKLQSGRLGRRIQWSVSSRDDINNLRSSLEAQKSCIEIALGVGSIQLLSVTAQKVKTRDESSAVVQDGVAVLGRDTAHIRERVDILPELAMEMTALRAEMARLAQAYGQRNTQLNEFVEESVNFARELTNPFAEELAAVESSQAETVPSQTEAVPSRSDAVPAAVRRRPVSSASSGQSAHTPTPSQDSIGSIQVLTPTPSHDNSPVTFLHELRSSSQERNASHPDTPSNTSQPRLPARLPDRGVHGLPAIHTGPKLTAGQQLALNSKFLMLFVRKFDRDGCAHQAPNCVHVQEMERLLDAGADVNFASNSTGVTPLMAEVGHEVSRASVVQFLINRGAALHDPAVLRTALQSRNTHIVRMLERSGAEVNDPTLLCDAAANLDFDMIRVLFDIGTDPNAVSADGHAALTCAMRYKPVNEMEGPRTKDPAHTRMAKINNTLTLLLENGSDVNVENFVGETALDYALRLYNSQPVELLLKYGAMVNQRHFQFVSQALNTYDNRSSVRNVLSQIMNLLKAYC